MPTRSERKRQLHLRGEPERLKRLWQDLLRETRTGSPEDRKRLREDALRLIDDLEPAKVRVRPENLRHHHVRILALYWQGRGLAPKTIRNRLTTVRKLPTLAGCPHVVLPDNAPYLRPPEG